MRRRGRRVLSFAAIGVLGYGVDVAALYAGLKLGAGPYVGRFISYVCAVTMTWYLNRKLTFADWSDPNALREWGRFFVSQLSGAGVNLGSYAVLTYAFAVFAGHPWLAVAIGSLAGMAANYTMARKFVFRRPS